MIDSSAMNYKSADNNDCAVLGIIQIVIGGILLVASLYGFSILQSNVVMLPALMAVALIGNGIHSLLVKCTAFKITDLQHE